jgi:hypothetical protein
MNYKIITGYFPTPITNAFAFPLINTSAKNGGGSILIQDAAPIDG